MFDFRESAFGQKQPFRITVTDYFVIIFIEKHFNTAITPLANMVKNTGINNMC